MQPQKEVKRKDKNLLERLQFKYKVEFTMELQGFNNNYQLDGTRSQKILVSFRGEFLGSAKNIDQAISIIAIFEQRNEDEYNKSKIRTTYIAEEEQVDTKMYEERMPRRITSKNGIKMYGKQFYIAKKKPDGTSSGKVFCLYNFETRNLLAVHWDRDILVGWLMKRYKEIEHKDV